MRLLFEIGMEELPARFLKQALSDLKSNLETKLNNERIKFDEIKTYGTPRRLVLDVHNLAENQEDLDLVNLGPAKSVAYVNGEISRAGLGFAKSQGIEPEQLEIVSTPKGEYIAARKFMKGKATKELLSEILKSLVLELNFPKSMKWADKKLRFARPVQWFLALCDSEVVPFEIEGIASGNKSRGHRFFGKEFEVSNVEEYFTKIRENNVIIDIEERRALVKDLVAKCAGAGEQVHIEEELLDEVTNLIEYPCPIVGSFNADFLEVPQDVLIISMQVHQRYFPILDTNGKLLPKFVVVTAFVVTAIVSTFTGTSWGSAATSGVAFMGIATSMGIPLPLVAGAIISGAFFGDKVSPVSDTTNLSALASEVTVYDHIKGMLPNVTISAIIAIIGYTLVGTFYYNGNSQLSEATLKNYSYNLRKLCKFFNKPVSMITSDDIKMFMYSESSTKSPAGMNTFMTPIKLFFAWLQNEEFIIKNPCSSIKPVKEPKREKKPLNEEQVEMLRDCMLSRRDRAILEFFLSTGCRVAEVGNVKVKDLDMTHKTLLVIGKGNKERRVYFTERCKRAILNYLREREEQGIISEYLFCSSKAPKKKSINKEPYKKLNNRGYQVIVDKMQKMANIEMRITPHTLRHTFATFALRSGMKPEVIQQILGHNDVGLTLRVYARVAQTDIEYSYRKLVS